MKRSVEKHITTSATTTVRSETVQVYQVLITCRDAGTSWTIKIQSKEGTPKMLIPAYTLTIGMTLFDFTQSVPMRDGLDIITTGATPGVADVFIVMEATS